MTERQRRVRSGRHIGNKVQIWWRVLDPLLVVGHEILEGIARISHLCSPLIQGTCRWPVIPLTLQAWRYNI